MVMEIFHTIPSTLPDTLTRTYAPTSSAALRRPQTAPRSPLSSARNLASAWKERTPVPRARGDKPSDSNSNSLPMDSEGLHGLRRRVQRAGVRLRESGGLRPPTDPSSSKRGTLLRLIAGKDAKRSFILTCYFSLGLCLEAGAVYARDDAGTTAARIQSAEADGQPLVDMLVPFLMMEAMSRPVSISESRLTRSPAASIRTIDSHASSTSVGSRSTVFASPLHVLPGIAVYQPESSPPPPPPPHLSFSSHHSGAVGDTVIQNEGYIYPGDRCVMAPSRGNSLRRSGSMTDMDSEFNSDRPRGKRPSSGNVRKMLEYSPASLSSGSSLGRNAYITPPTSTGTDSRPVSGITDDAFFSASSSGTRSNVSSAYYSSTEWAGTGPGTQTGNNTASGLRSDSIAGLIVQTGPSSLAYGTDASNQS
ncbi:hypothetical protein NP233_g2056 [Leucocoprinus birnbaumii]|uniref:Uncharacterized protein n=1 Tax=Leucocoprinus birnbaumii TaxID=56174 RepID=A0AAD5W4Y3_9AGAR|nr:hypothetical protein NP233_g2056 [Leucocoprinus birnbaumii]